MPMPGHHNALNATAAIAVAHRARHAASTRSARRSRASAASSGASPAPASGTAPRSSTITATIRSRSPPCCAPRAPRPSAQVIAVVQPHRYSRLQSLFNEFATCFNDADTVIVADVYAGRRGADRGRRPRRARRRHQGARPPQRRWRSRAPADLRRHRPRARQARRLRRAASAPATSRNGPTRCRAQLAARRRQREPGRRLDDARRRRACPTCDAARRATWPLRRALAPLTWFRVGGPAEVLFVPADEADLAYALAAHPGGACPVTVDRPRLQPHRARRRRRRAW